MRRFLAVAMVLMSFALILASADAQQQGKGKRGKGKGGFGGGDPEATFKKLDTNSDGKLSKEEYLKTADRIQDAEKAAKLKEFLGKAYDKANTGGDGLTLEQYKTMREQQRQNFR